MLSISANAAVTSGRSSFTKYWDSDKSLRLEHGGTLSYRLAYRTWGRLSAKADNAVIVCHALTGSADADEWWPAMFGANKALDPGRDFVVCSNVLGGCYGSTGPASCDASGRRYGNAFPLLTIRDQVQAQMFLADALGIRRIKLVIGGSMGGLHSLEWALMDPLRVQAVAIIAASAEHSAWCMAWSEAQRLALRADSKFREGNYDASDPPLAGLAAARAIAMATYRSPSALQERYGRNTGASVFGERASAPGDFAVRAWLRHHARQFIERFDTHCYLALLDAMDSHDVGRGRGGTKAALGRVMQPSLVVAIDSDGLYSPAEQMSLSADLPRARFVQLHSLHGHDGFLIDAANLEPHVRHFRKDAEAVASEITEGVP
ncbi:MAG: homoserine O-acetyltransferase MetX [Dyella sp.]|uniref:homoserine O-acetyltransferase MetX n=1 Tax=Dyella sp. TaxID=1869338 RepID=UPI003F7F48A0